MLLDVSQPLACWLHKKKSETMLFDGDAETLPDSSATLAEAVEWLRAAGFIVGDQRHVATVTRDTDDA